MTSMLLVALGGALGASARYGVSLWAGQAFSASFPAATLLVNAVGCFAMGALAAWLGKDQSGLLLFLGAGVLGGFTTFSAFSIETLRLLQDGAWTTALVYGLASVVLAVGACAAGYGMVRGAG
jgi:CrcB protein